MDDILRKMTRGGANLVQCYEHFRVALASHPDVRSVAIPYFMSRCRAATDEEWADLIANTARNHEAIAIAELGRLFLALDESLVSRRHRVLFWLIDHHPRLEVHSCPEAWMHGTKDDRGYERGKRLWLAQIASCQSADATVLSHAAYFLAVRDPQLAMDLLVKAEAIDPDLEDWQARMRKLRGQ